MSQQIVPDPFPRTFDIRMVVYGGAAVAVFIVLYVLMRSGFPETGIKIGAALFAAYGTLAQAYLAADHGPARRASENPQAHESRLGWRDNGDFLAWAALCISVLAVAAAELPR